jgi:hypothetical protein
MKDIYLMDKTTGELIPAEMAILAFYKTHGALEDWTEYYEETDLEVDRSSISFPDFALAVAI